MKPQNTKPPSLFTLIILAGSAVIAINIYLPVLQIISQELNVSDAAAQYILTLFLATTAIAQLIIGPLSDRFGRRPILITAGIIFVAGSVVCVVAPNFTILLVGRCLQATSAAFLTLSRSILRDMYEREKAASMIGYVTMAMAVMPMVAPTIGGYSGETFGWKSTFVIILIFGIIALSLIYFDLGETHKPVRNKVSTQAMEYITLMRQPEIWGYFAILALTAGIFFAFLGGTPFVATKIIGMPPSELGLWFASVAAGYILGNFVSGKFSETIGVEKMMMWGSVIATIATISIVTLMAATNEPKAIYLFGPMFIIGLGNGMVLPNANAGAVSVNPKLAGAASGMGGFLQIGGGAFLAVIPAMLMSVENKAMPLYIIMFLSAFGATVIATMMLKVASPKTKTQTA